MKRKFMVTTILMYTRKCLSFIGFDFEMGFECRSGLVSLSSGTLGLLSCVVDMRYGMNGFTHNALPIK